MVVIRLARCGTRHRPQYRVTVADSRRPSTGRFIEIIGYYNPFEKDKKKAFTLNQEKYQKWLSQGAQASRTVLSLTKKVYPLKGEE